MSLGTSNGGASDTSATATPDAGTGSAPKTQTADAGTPSGYQGPSSGSTGTGSGTSTGSGSGTPGLPGSASGTGSQGAAPTSGTSGSGDENGANSGDSTGAGNAGTTRGGSLGIEPRLAVRMQRGAPGDGAVRPRALRPASSPWARSRSSRIAGVVAPGADVGTTGRAPSPFEIRARGDHSRARSLSTSATANLSTTLPTPKSEKAISPRTVRRTPRSAGRLEVKRS